MKIAVISDIHGNMEALTSVMEDINQEGCEKVFVLGDYAMAGPEPDKVIDKFMALHNNPNFVMIQGNTDLMIATFNEDLYQGLKEKAPIMSEALREDVRILSNEQKAFLGNLPVALEVEADGVKILLVHGSPRRNNEDILPDTPITEVEEMVKDVNADIVLCGHTHLPCGFQLKNKKTVVNVGSVGRPFTEKPNACYLKLTVENGKYLFEHKFIRYDKGTASSKLAKRHFEGAKKLAEMLMNPTVRHF